MSITPRRGSLELWTISEVFLMGSYLVTPCTEWKYLPIMAPSAASAIYLSCANYMSYCLLALIMIPCQAGVLAELETLREVMIGDPDEEVEDEEESEEESGPK